MIFGFGDVTCQSNARLSIRSHVDHGVNFEHANAMQTRVEKRVVTRSTERDYIDDTYTEVMGVHRSRQKQRLSYSLAVTTATSKRQHKRNRNNDDQGGRDHQYEDASIIQENNKDANVYHPARKSRKKYLGRMVSARQVAAAVVVIKFMRRYAKVGSTTRTLALATMSPSVTGASVELSQTMGHYAYMARVASGDTVRAMRRFMRCSGLFYAMVSTATATHASVLASRLLQCFDVCGCPASWSPAKSTRNSNSVEILASATMLSAKFSEARHAIIREEARGGARCVETQAGARGETQADLSPLLSTFESAMSAWCRENSAELKHRVQLTLFNLYDVEAVLRKGYEDSLGCCVCKPYLLAEAERYRWHATLVEKKFLKACRTSGGIEMLQEIHENYRASTGVGSATLTLGAPTATATATTVKKTKSEQEMHLILGEVRSYDSYSIESVIHEAVLSPTFYIKFAHLGRDDACINDANRLFEKGRDANLRTQLQWYGISSTSPVYRNALTSISHVRDHLEELEIHSHRELIFDWLDATKWKRSLDNGTMSWNDTLGVLYMIIFAMRFCVGSNASRAVLYSRRVAQRFQDTVATERSQDPGGVSTPSTCSNAELGLLTKSKTYRTAAAYRGRRDRRKSTKYHDDSRHDNPKYALDRGTYLRLNKQVNDLVGFETSHSTAQLGGVFCDTLMCIMEQLRRLDVSLANAYIYSVRLRSMTKHISTEQTSFAMWFSGGLGTRNTLAWLLQNERERRTVSASLNPRLITRLVFDGYISLITDKDSHLLEEVDYPELVILDIPYIHKTRGIFYGQVAQATVLVIVGQRLTEAGVAAGDIHQSLQRVAGSVAFVDLGRPETCRGEQRVVDSLQDAVWDVIHDLRPYRDCNSILREVARETAHKRYPSSPIASSIARKWTEATRTVLSTGLDTAIHPAFASPEDTRSAFATDLLLPTAALCIAREFHFTVLELVARTRFNVAVHAERYRELAHEM